ncbi:2-polyprenyl-3-methyl-5-hydroxy-6-metoxy-1,4-benzoquinol methylase [Streptomyces sp. V4I2]|nr:2-polyprenyl-3-methyl-5-hydroxy-6-metoxy-1,4-benzoquinol methylase [Streptomyces sp. V4I2]
MMLRKELIEESVGWDTVNWSRALAFWERRTSLCPTGLRALEVGAGGTHGNLTLWLAAKGFRVVLGRGGAVGRASPLSRRLRGRAGC